MVHHLICLPLLLTCLAGIFASERVQGKTVKETASYGPSSVMITGVDTVTVGVPYGFQCSAQCSPACKFTWTRGNLTSQGPELTLVLKERVPPQVLTCVAVNPITGKSVTVQKTLQVTVGPSNIKISGPPMLSIGAVSTFACSADCYPSCSYTWSISWEGETLETSQGNTTSITPPATADIETLICEAQGTLSHLFITTSLDVWVARLLDIYITGPSSVTVGRKYTFTCFVTCTPSCNYTWTLDKEVFHGDQIELPILDKGDKPVVVSKLQVSIGDYSSSVPLTCEAQNTASGATITTTKTLTVINPISVRPVSQDQPVAGQPFSLQCVGSQNPASIIWLKNGLSIPMSNRVHLSPHNTTLTFSPLLQSDGGLYECLVSEGEVSIKSVGQQVKVNFGPLQVVITQPNKGPVGKEMYVLPGSTTALECSADCYPVCSYSWMYNAKLLATDASLLFKPGTPPNKGVLTCVAYNSVTKDSSSATTTAFIAEGPVKVAISGPDSLEVGVKASFKCTSQCSPSCSYTWSVFGRTMTGSVIDITVSRYVATESISCEARNTITGRSATVNETLTVTDLHWCGC